MINKSPTENAVGLFVVIKSFLSRSAEEQHDDLCREDSEEHAERIYRGIAHCRRFFAACGVGISQCGRVGIGSGDQSHDGEIVEFVFQPCDGSDDEDGDHGNEESGIDIFQSVAGYHGLPESGPGLDADAGQEQHETYLTEHHVGRSGGVGNQLKAVSESSDEDGDDQRSAGNTEFQGHRHAGNGEGYAAEEYSDNDSDEDGGDVGGVESLGRIAHHLGHTVHVFFTTDDHDLVAHVEMVVARGKEVHALTGYSGDIHAENA